MRKLVLVLALLISGLVFSQDCQLNKTVDDFDKSETLVSKKTRIGQISNLGYLNTKLFKFTKDGNENLIIGFYQNKYVKECKTRDSYAEILFEDDTTLKLDAATSKIDCGVNYVWLSMTEDDVDDLINKKISKIRVHIEYYRDYDVVKKEKFLNKFVNNLKCLLSE